MLASAMPRTDDRKNDGQRMGDEAATNANSPALYPLMKSDLTHVQIAAVATVSTLAWLTSSVQPYEVSVLGRAYGVSPAEGGLMISVELLSLTASIMLASRAIGQADKRWLCLTGLAIAIAASLVSLVHVPFEALCVARVAFGWGLGMIAAACNAIVGRHSEPERVFSFMWLAISVPSALILYLEPRVEQAFGPHGMFACQLAFLLVLGPVSFLLPADRLVPVPGSTPAAVMPISPWILRYLVGTAVIFVGTNSMWSYIEQAGLKAGLDTQGIATVLSISAMMNFVGPAFGAWLGTRIGHFMPITLGIVALMVDALLIYAVPYAPAYVTGVLAFNTLASFIGPYMLGLLADADDSGRSAVLGGAATNLGLATGPMTGGALLLLQSEPIIGFVAIGLFSISLALFFTGRRWRVRQS
jgi:predicted MFS family arabinose efflux permease